MDINCANCGEPWEYYHLQHDMPYDADLDYDFLKSKIGKMPVLKIPGMRKALKTAGWLFAGNSVAAVLRCPCCKSNKRHGGGILHDAAERQYRTDIATAAAIMCDGDDDGIAAMLSDEY